MIACKVRKYLLSPFVTSNVVLSCLVRMADILARLAQKAGTLSALQLIGALCYSLSNTPTPPFISTPSLRPPPPPPPPHFLDCSAAPGRCVIKLTANNTPANIELQKLLALLVCGFQSCSCFACEFLAYM